MSSSPSSDSHSSYFPTGKMLSLGWSKEGGIRARRTGRRGWGSHLLGKGGLSCEYIATDIGGQVLIFQTEE